jgi:hypothetical protein
VEYLDATPRLPRPSAAVSDFDAIAEHGTVLVVRHRTKPLDELQPVGQPGPSAIDAESSICRYAVAHHELVHRVTFVFEPVAAADAEPSLEAIVACQFGKERGEPRNVPVETRLRGDVDADATGG